MQYVKSVEAALRGTAPFVAIPVEGHAPACVRSSLLKGALKGVKVHSVKIITANPSTTSDSGRWLQIKGIAEGGVRTSCKIVVTNTRNHLVWLELSKWADKEREKRVKVISQGILNPAERKALKLKEAMEKEERRRNAELIAAQREEAQILAQARSRVFPDITPDDEESRARVIAEYSEFRSHRFNRKRASVIRWKLAKLREQVKAMTTEKREYEEKPRISIYSRRRRTCIGKTTVLRRKKDAMQYAAAVYQIGKLESEFKALYPPRWHEWASLEDGGYWVDSFIAKRPKGKTYRVPWQWERSEDVDTLRKLAERLREARANIRALTPPPDEDEDELPIAA
jgi:hypothetical protein